MIKSNADKTELVKLCDKYPFPLSDLLGVPVKGQK